eukprot:GHUV01020212.1.p1 GENE.GHUV01020212.1~~GHUV01020212.1.p1  ORF type:complete len:231 (+),score=41.82 GHUV01020212.1:254-946(+)
MDVRLVPNLKCHRLGLQHQHQAFRRVAAAANPLLRFFAGESGNHPADQRQQKQQKLGPGQMEVLHPRRYQQDLIGVAKDANALIALPTGSGKTLIAAEVIRHKLPALKAAGKAVIFLAPTNPLVEQQCNEIFIKKHGLRAIALHGNASSQPINSWSAERSGSSHLMCCATARSLWAIICVWSACTVVPLCVCSSSWLQGAPLQKRSGHTDLLSYLCSGVSRVCDCCKASA